MFRDLVNAILKVIFGHNAVENTAEWKAAHDKANRSRADVNNILDTEDKKG